jgi:hypothetical protein
VCYGVSRRWRRFKRRLKRLFLQSPYNRIPTRRNTECSICLTPNEAQRLGATQPRGSAATASCLAVTAAAHNSAFSILHSQFLNADYSRPAGFANPKGRKRRSETITYLFQNDYRSLEKRLPINFETITIV